MQQENDVVKQICYNTNILAHFRQDWFSEFIMPKTKRNIKIFSFCRI